MRSFSLKFALLASSLAPSAFASATMIDESTQSPARASQSFLTDRNIVALDPKNDSLKIISPLFLKIGGVNLPSDIIVHLGSVMPVLPLEEAFSLAKTCKSFYAYLPSRMQLSWYPADSTIRFGGSFVQMCVPKIIELDLRFDTTLQDVNLKNFINLQDLNLMYNSKITNIGLTSLRNLDLSMNEIITNDVLSHLTTITNLSLQHNNKITDEGVLPLTNLLHLHLGSNNQISDNVVSCLTNLQTLKLIENDMISDKSVSDLINLQTLNLGDNLMITEKCLSRLTNLTDLDLWNNTIITTESVLYLTKLTQIDLFKNTNIKPTDLKHLPNLKITY